MSAPRLGWYGDDFTGATDTLAVLAQAGRRAMLFLGVPDAQRLAQAARALGGPLDAVGIAGAARSMDPQAMARELEPVGTFFARLAPRVLHYKVCSTFDSAPHVGSIGQAVRVLRPFVESPVVPVVGGQPSLGRYCVFSNLFAAAGRGGAVERIDRHPTMSRHPVTPMPEADLRRHLALQGLDDVGALHGPVYAQGSDAVAAAWASQAEAGRSTVLLDVADAGHLAGVGALLWRLAAAQRLLAVGPSSVAQALLTQWAASEPVAAARQGGSDEPVLVVAGSLSPVTARQVDAATSFLRIGLQLEDLLDPQRSADAARAVGFAMDQGRHVLVVTAPADPASADVRRAGDVAAATARFVRALLQQRAERGRPVRRLGIAGGDTSSLVTQALGLWGLSYAGHLGAGVAVSTTHSGDATVDGLRLMLKGGQMGAVDVFEQFLGVVPAP